MRAISIAIITSVAIVILMITSNLTPGAARYTAIHDTAFALCVAFLGFMVIYNPFKYIEKQCIQKLLKQGGMVFGADSRQTLYNGVVGYVGEIRLILLYNGNMQLEEKDNKFHCNELGITLERVTPFQITKPKSWGSGYIIQQPKIGLIRGVGYKAEFVEEITQKITEWLEHQII